MAIRVRISSSSLPLADLAFGAIWPLLLVRPLPERLSKRYLRTDLLAGRHLWKTARQQCCASTDSREAACKTVHHFATESNRSTDVGWIDRQGFGGTQGCYKMLPCRVMNNYRGLASQPCRLPLPWSKRPMRTWQYGDAATLGNLEVISRKVSMHMRYQKMRHDKFTKLP
jgi:hypothetical protein